MFELLLGLYYIADSSMALIGLTCYLPTDAVCFEGQTAFADIACRNIILIRPQHCVWRNDLIFKRRLQNE